MRIFCLKQKTAYEMRISDWSSDVCSSDLHVHAGHGLIARHGAMPHCRMVHALLCPAVSRHALHVGMIHSGHSSLGCDGSGNACCKLPGRILRSEEHTSELQSLMRISYAVFCLNQKNTKTTDTTNSQ